MNAKQLEELREHPRRGLSGRKAGELRLGDSGRRIIYEGVDVSKSGLGIVTMESINEPTVVLELAGEAVELEVVWSAFGNASASAKRYGFRVKDRSVDLDRLIG